MNIADAGEFGLISRVTARLPSNRATLLGPGDIAAMGATPSALLVAFCAPPDLDLGWAEELTDGLAAEAGTAGAAVVGGDTSSSPVLTIAVTALGDLGGREPVLRSGARLGDRVAYAGRLGYAAGGYTVLSRGLDGPQLLIEAHRRPIVPYPAGPAAANAGATSMIDVSDGLLADAGHVAAASRVRIDLDSAAFEVPAELAGAARDLGTDPLSWILTGGDDHALLATFPGDVTPPEGWRIVGRVLEGAGGSGVGVTVDGRRYDGPAGWDHFR